MRTSTPYNFLNSTIIFSIIGIFLGGFTIFISYGFQQLILNTGIECVKSMQITWVFMLISSLFLPVIFGFYIKKIKKEEVKNLTSKNVIFNFLELTFLQTALAIFFSKPEILCFGKGGQNGLELVFTAWLSIPILILFSLIFNRIYLNNNND